MGWKERERDGGVGDVRRIMQYIVALQPNERVSEEVGENPASCSVSTCYANWRVSEKSRSGPALHIVRNP